jgi:hypothetical protein
VLAVHRRKRAKAVAAACSRFNPLRRQEPQRQPPVLNIEERRIMRITKHVQQRLSQRAIDMDAVSLALNFGLKIEQNGATVHFLGRRQLPRGLSRDEADDLEGTTVVLARSGGVVTVYRTHRLPRIIRRRRHRRQSRHGTVSSWN